AWDALCSAATTSACHGACNSTYFEDVKTSAAPCARSSRRRFSRQDQKRVPEQGLDGRLRTAPALLDDRERTAYLCVLEPHAAKGAERHLLIVPALERWSGWLFFSFFFLSTYCRPKTRSASRPLWRRHLRARFAASSVPPRARAFR